MSALVFGKLPAHGDFVVRGVKAATRTTLDDWLSASLADAREALGEAFAERFDHALPWRCTGPGVVGAIAASQDAVGRRFPVLLLAGDSGNGTAHCEDLLYRAIGEGWDADTLAAAGGDLPEGDVDSWFGRDGSRRDGARPADLIMAMLA